MRKKAAKVDFQPSMMPKNRFGLFGDIYKNRFMLMLDLGLLLLLFSLPAAITMSVVNMKTYEINQQIVSNLITAEKGAEDIFHMINVGNAVFIADCVLLAIGISGAVGVMRRLIFQEGVLFRADFTKSLKENAACYAVIGFILGTLNFMLQYCLRSSYFDDGIGMQFAIGALIIAAYITCFISPMILNQATVYNISFIGKIKNAFLLSMRMPHLSFLLTVINAAPYFILFINNQYVYLATLVLLPVLIMPMQILINMSVCDSILDRFINKQNHPQIYRKGMFVNAENNDSKTDQILH